MMGRLMTLWFHPILLKSLRTNLRNPEMIHSSCASRSGLIRIGDSIRARGTGCSNYHSSDRKGRTTRNRMA